MGSRARDEDFRQNADEDEVGGADDRDAGQHVVDVFAVALTGRMPGMKPPCFFRLSAVSFGLKTMAV